MRISHVLLAPIFLASIVIMISSYAVYYGNQTGKNLEYQYQILNDNELRFNALAAEYSTILVFADLIVGSDQGFLIERYQNQSKVLRKQIKTVLLADNWCCSHTDTVNLHSSLITMEGVIATAVSSDLQTNPALQTEYLNRLDDAAVVGLQSLDNIQVEVKALIGAHSLLLAESRTAYRFGLVGLGLIDLIAIIGSWIWVSTHVSRPVKTLVSASNKAFISGHFHNTNNTGPVELKTLSNAFERLTNHLGDQLEAERNKVKKQELEARNELWKLAHTDVLTQGPNRSQFNQTFQELIAKCNANKETFDIFIVDINEFKSINDTLGHMAGDELLVAITQVLEKVVGDNGLSARLGGDEFGLLVTPAMQEPALEDFIKNIIDGCNVLTFSDGMRHGVDVSIGVATFPHDAKDIGSLLKAADTAMYRAKRDSVAGSCWLHYLPQMDTERQRRAWLRNLVAAGIENKEFELYCQPIIDASTRKVVSGECLLRWPSGPEHVTIPEIINIAETSGLILELTVEILEQACSFIAALEAHGLSTSVAVNISAVQFKYQNIVSILKTAIERSNISADRLVIEITESVFVGSFARVKQTFSELQDLGIDIAIDDFGTGYSSLNYLNELNADWLKIDQSFINNIDKPDGERFVYAFTELSRAVGTKMVAEGVETLKQLQILQKLNVERIQGYYISKPIPKAEFIKFALNSQQVRTGSVTKLR